MARTLALRRAPPRRAASTAEPHAPAIPDPRTRAQWITRVALVLLHQTATQTSPCSGRTASSGELAATEQCSGELRRRPAHPLEPGRAICFLRTRLDRVQIRSEPPDCDPTAEIHPYPFGLSLLLKSPRLSLKSTRSPSSSKVIPVRPKILHKPPQAFQKSNPPSRPVVFVC